MRNLESSLRSSKPNSPAAKLWRISPMARLRGDKMTGRTICRVVLAVLFVPSGVIAQSGAPTSSPSTPVQGLGLPPGAAVPKNLTRYYIGFLIKGRRWTADQKSPAQQALFRAHLDYVRTRIERRDYLLAGPFLDSGRITGLSVISAASLKEAVRIMSDDPAVKAGRLGVEVHPALLPSLDSVHVIF
jgi:uncharacterized protein YciI